MSSIKALDSSAMSNSEFKKFSNDNNLKFYMTRDDAADNVNEVSMNFDWLGDDGDLYISDNKLYEKQKNGNDDIVLAYVNSDSNNNATNSDLKGEKIKSVSRGTKTNYEKPTTNASNTDVKNNDKGVKGVKRDNNANTTTNANKISEKYDVKETDKYKKFYDENGKLVGTLVKKNNLYVDYSDPTGAKFKRLNPKTKTLQDVSIFDNENLSSSQYGASQDAFINDFSSLIKDKNIWNEMQKYYPVESFKSKDEAMRFYERYFDVVGHAGCGYAAATNVIFKQYEGKEKEFEDTFGFPMYNVDDYGNLNFNYENMELAYFNYTCGNYDIDKMEKGYNNTNKIQDVFTGAISPGANLNQLSGFLNTYGVDCNSNMGDSKNYTYFKSDATINEQSSALSSQNDYVVFGGEGYDLYDMNGNMVKASGGGHYMMITDYTSEGFPIVSSWGNKYILDIKGNENRIADAYRYTDINFGA